VIPREGVERRRDLIRDQVKLTETEVVIPREGVESGAFEWLYQQLVGGVIPREGVES